MGDTADEAWRTTLVTQFRDRLEAPNADYREALGEFPAAMQPVVAVYESGEGPFAANAGRIKPRRIVQPSRT